MNMKNKVVNDIKTYHLIEKGDKVIVGVSGGPDSITLLDLLVKIKREDRINFEIIVCHINHMIRKEAVDDEKYVLSYCDKNHIKCYIKRADVEQIAKEQKIGTEEAGRKVRYDFFNQILKKERGNKIATAHTANDNAETVLMNIIRGSGTSGLVGIEALRGNLIRPLIHCTRNEIENYCKENNLNPRIDKTNFENTYTRNKVRNMLIPYIKENFNPNIIDSINRLSSLSKEENKYLEEKTIEAYHQIKREDEQSEIFEKALVLDLKQFNRLERVIKNRVVLYTINILLGTKNGIEKKHIDDIIKLCSNNIGNKFLIPNKRIKILVKNKKIFFISI